MEKTFEASLNQLETIVKQLEAGELPNADAHGVARMNQAVGGRLNAAVGSVGITGRPISRAFYFAGLNRPIADRCARQQTIGESECINEWFES